MFTFIKNKFEPLDYLEKLTVVLGVWFLIYPNPYKILFTALALIPILGLFFSGVRKKKRLDELLEIEVGEKNKLRFNFFDFIEFAPFFLLGRVMMDFECESYYSLLIPISITFIVVMVYLFITHQLVSKLSLHVATIYGLLTFYFFIYSCAVTYGANCLYDTSEAKVFRVKVVDKSIYKSRKGRKTYRLKVQPWGHHYDPENINVSYDKYESTNIGDMVNIDLKKGLFNIPWYFIE